MQKTEIWPEDSCQSKRFLRGVGFWLRGNTKGLQPVRGGGLTVATCPVFSKDYNDFFGGFKPIFTEFLVDLDKSLTSFW
jgi:hypothetical protein